MELIAIIILSKAVFLQTTEISRRYAELHAEYADYIYEAMQDSVENGTPVVAPLWWADPNDDQTFDIWDGKVFFFRLLLKV